MIDYIEHIKAAIQATDFHSPTSYSWFGMRNRQPSAKVRRALTPDTARNFLLFNLQSQLYNDFYCRGYATRSRQDMSNFVVPVSSSSFVEQLSSVNAGTGHWEHGWLVREITNDGIVVYKNGLELLALQEDYLKPQEDEIAEGRLVSLRLPKDFLGISPGFYMALGNTAFPQNELQNLVRIYWNISTAGAIQLMKSITSILNQAGLPFKLKVLNNPRNYSRCDAAVLYVGKSSYEAISRILQGPYMEIAPSLGSNIPIFTKLLSKGVGLAEDPGEGVSFGLHRCGILAEGMVRAYEQGKESTEERLQIVFDHFRECQIEIERPFLNLGSSDGYDIQWENFQPSQVAYQYASHRDIENDTFLQSAHEIGRALLQDAIWWENRCTWMGVEASAHTAGQAYRSLGPELYDGTCGVAMFLAELYAATGDKSFLRTACGAIRHALSKVELVPPRVRLGVYTGWTGIAFAAARLGIVLNDSEWIERSKQLMHRTCKEYQAETEFDMISGKAGAIVALTVLKAILDVNELLDFAQRLGTELVNTAEISEVGYSWKSLSVSNQHNLTGFSHGTAGVGYALLELYQATGTDEFRKVANLAFEYERYWFDEEQCNWPDFRQEPSQTTQYEHADTFSTFWCHGAPGIAISRLRAYEILGDDSYRIEANSALRTTRDIINKWLKTGIGNFSLCHGLAGNADILIYGTQVLNENTMSHSVLAREVGRFGIETYAEQHQWPCGAIGETPNLMLGLAGIGYFYLRLHNSTVPSVLMLHNGIAGEGTVTAATGRP